jgi:hypothetical protein
MAVRFFCLVRGAIFALNLSLLSSDLRVSAILKGARKIKTVVRVEEIGRTGKLELNVIHNKKITLRLDKGEAL